MIISDGSTKLPASDYALRHGRKLELDRHPTPPAGLEVHSRGIFHETQRGDSLYAIARDYSQQFHMDVSPASLSEANKAVLANGLHPGDLLQIPGLEERTDSFFLSMHPSLQPERGQLRHNVARGESLSSIARHYKETEGLDLPWQSIFAANGSTIGDNPNLIKPGQMLRIPGISMHSPDASLKSLSDLDQQVLLTRTARVQHEAGGVSTIDVMRMRADGSHAEHVGSSAYQAVKAAHAALEGDSARSNSIAVAQTKDGAYWIVPLRTEEASENLDHTDRTLSLAYRADDRSVRAIVTRDHTGETSVRRFDR